MQFLLRITTVLFSLVLLSGIACRKEGSAAQTTVDVSRQWDIDALGNLVFGYADGQWQSARFTPTEMNLFHRFDTASLAGTSRPADVLETTLNLNSVFPNPFVESGGHRLQFHFTPGYSGTVLLKAVYVDSLLHPVYSTAMRFSSAALPLPTPALSELIAIRPTVEIGRYRLYYTLSAAGAPDFYKAWGDVERNR